MRQANAIPVIYATREKNPTNIDLMIYYSEDYSDEYVIQHDGESYISFPGVPVGAEVIRVDLEIKTISKGDWSWNPNSRVLTLTPLNIGAVDNPTVYPTSKDQLLSIIYKIKKTTL